MLKDLCVPTSVNFDTRFLRNTYRKRLQAVPLTVEKRQSYLLTRIRCRISRLYLLRNVIDKTDFGEGEHAGSPLQDA